MFAQSILTREQHDTAMRLRSLRHDLFANAPTADRERRYDHAVGKLNDDQRLALASVALDRRPDCSASRSRRTIWPRRRRCSPPWTRSGSRHGQKPHSRCSAHRRAHPSEPLALEEIAEFEEERPRKLTRARHVTQLALLESRGAISERQRAAGERLASDFRRAGDMPNVVMRYEVRLEQPTKGAFAFRSEPGSAQLDGRRRFERAVQAVGIWLSPIVMHVASSMGRSRPGAASG
jgi:Domain of unknown function (DUF6456)